MPTLAAQGDFYPHSLFFGDHDRIKTLPADVDRKAAKLAQCIANPLEQVSMLLDQELCSVAAKIFLVAYGAEDDIAW